MVLMGLMALVSCEQPYIEDVPEYDKTEILSFRVYDVNKKDVLVGSVSIDAEAGVVSATIAEGTDLSQLFAICSLSSGATLSPALGGYQDWGDGVRHFTVTSASGTRVKQWTVMLTIASE